MSAPLLRRRFTAREYKSVTRNAPGTSIAPLAFRGLGVAVQDILPRSG